MPKRVSKRPQTQNAGAALERQAIRNWVRRNTIKYPKHTPYVTAEKFLNYLDGRTRRNNKAKGSLGIESKKK